MYASFHIRRVASRSGFRHPRPAIAERSVRKATLLKPTQPYPLPPGTEIVDKDGKPHARIGEGRKVTLCLLTKDRTK